SETFSPVLVCAADTTPATQGSALATASPTPPLAVFQTGTQHVKGDFTVAIGCNLATVGQTTYVFMWADVRQPDGQLVQFPQIFLDGVNRDLSVGVQAAGVGLYQGLVTNETALQGGMGGASGQSFTNVPQGSTLTVAYAIW